MVKGQRKITLTEFYHMPYSTLSVFYLLALHCSPVPVSLDAAAPHLDFLWLEDGSFDGGVWKPLRRLNGDEAVMLRCDAPALLHMKLLQYQ